MNEEKKENFRFYFENEQRNAVPLDDMMARISKEEQDEVLAMAEAKSRDFNPEPLPADASEEEVAAEAKAESEFFAYPDFTAKYTAPSGAVLSVKLREGSLLHLIDEEPVSETQFKTTLLAIPGDAFAFEVEGTGKEFIVRRPNAKLINRNIAKSNQDRLNAFKMQELKEWNDEIAAKRAARKGSKRGLAMPQMTK